MSRIQVRDFNLPLIRRGDLQFNLPGADGIDIALLPHKVGFYFGSIKLWVAADELPVRFVYELSYVVPKADPPTPAEPWSWRRWLGLTPPIGSSTAPPEPNDSSAAYVGRWGHDPAGT